MKFISNLKQLFFPTKITIISDALVGIKIKPIVTNGYEEPFNTFSRKMTEELLKRGVRLDPESDWECELDWEILGGSQLRVKAATQIGPFFVKTDVREGIPAREVVDFDMDSIFFMNYDKKVLLFFETAATKLVKQLEINYRRHLLNKITAYMREEQE